MADTDDRLPDRPGGDDPGRGRRLGVDVGTVRIGVAASDPDGILATPVETVRRDRSNKHLRRLAQLAAELEAVEVVVGLPRTLADRSGPSARDAVELAEQLAGRIAPTPVRLSDERLTTVSAQRSLREAGIRAKGQRAMIDQAAASLRSAEADLSRAQLDFKRYTALVTSDYASRQRYESADADSRKADAALGKARAALVAEQSQLAVLESQRREEEAKLAQARATRQLAKNDLDNTVIRAPVAGIAGNRAGQIGQYVKPGTQLLSLVPLPRVFVTANFKETQLTHMRPGQPAEISVDAYPDQPLQGQVESFAPGSGAQFSLLPPDNATGNFTKVVQRVPVRIAVPANGPLVRLLRPGLSVTVTVDTRREGTAEAADGIVGAAHAEPASPGGRASP